MSFDEVAGADVLASTDVVRQIADAVLYEGYILYPYRASAQKNRSRWQFGVLMPPAYAAADPSESPTLRAECIVEHGGSGNSGSGNSGQPSVEVTARFLQVQRRTTGGATLGTGTPPGMGAPPTWDEAVACEVCATAAGPSLLRTADGTATRFTVPGGEEVEVVSGTRVVRQRAALSGSVSICATPLPGPWQAARLTVTLTNESVGTAAAMAGTAASRDAALPTALVAAHLIITVSGGAFISMTDSPEWARPHVGACENTGCWPVLAGQPGSRQVMLAAPIILPDYPEVAPESPGELYDGTEIDEILTLRTLALSDAEKAAARVTDPRAAALIDRVEAMDAPAMERLHGTIRAMSVLRPANGAAGAAAGDAVPWWDPGADAAVNPDTDSVLVAGHRIAHGSRVILRPGARRADAQDMFLAGRAAVVEAVLMDVDDTTYLAVTLADDPAADLQAAHGRFLYFSPDEVEPDRGGAVP
ncbi:MAG: hypothetical protein JWM19_1836 [Actinomycetia bacterium]|nr:hypothetical protein [Actinomycetes bacterium]